MGTTKPEQALKILLAEDGLANQKLMLGILERLGYQVTVAKDGREAVQYYDSERFDLVLMGCANARDGWSGSFAPNQKDRTRQGIRNSPSSPSLRMPVVKTSGDAWNPE